MEDSGIISPVDQHSQWCAGTVVVSKPNGKVRICVDFIKLNRTALRENHHLPCAGYTLAQLANVKVCSKLDTNSSF